MSRASLPSNLTPAAARTIAAGLLASRRRRHGDATMTAPPQTDQQQGQQGGQQGGTNGGGDSGQQGSGQGGQSGASGQNGGQSGGQNGGQQQAQPEAKFTQSDLDRYLGQRLAEEQAKWQKKVDDAAALAGKSTEEKLALERDQAEAAATEATQKAAQRIARTEAKGIARDLDARPDRLDAILRQADLSKAVKDDGDIDEAAVKTAVEKVLADYPEWKKGPGGPSASGGELNGGGGGDKPTFTRKQLEEMPPEEVARRIDEINEAVRDGRVTG